MEVQRYLKEIKCSFLREKCCAGVGIIKSSVMENQMKRAKSDSESILVRPKNRARTINDHAETLICDYGCFSIISDANEPVFVINALSPICNTYTELRSMHTAFIQFGSFVLLGRRPRQRLIWN